jgi:hypothetical protein
MCLGVGSVCNVLGVWDSDGFVSMVIVSDSDPAATSGVFLSIVETCSVCEHLEGVTSHSDASGIIFLCWIFGDAVRVCEDSEAIRKGSFGRDRGVEQYELIALSCVLVPVFPCAGWGEVIVWVTWS